MQSTDDRLHVAIIMDGNGRWGARHGLSRTAGHHAGVPAVRRVVEAAPALGIGTLSLFAFSSDNWRRPSEEVDGMMELLRLYLRAETAPLVARGVRLSVIGRRDRLPPGLPEAIAAVERATEGGERLHVRIAVDYSARDAMLRAMAGLAGAAAPSRETFGRLLGGKSAAGRDVDLLIRTSGEKRLSDFLLWESAYAELAFTERMWPDFGADDLRETLADFRGRERRFGGLKPAPALLALAATAA